jgi:hypothetical protein
MQEKSVMIGRQIYKVSVENGGFESIRATFTPLGKDGKPMPNMLL